MDASASQRLLNAWLSHYVDPIEHPAPGAQSRRPLREASVSVCALDTGDGVRRFELRVSPYVDASQTPVTLTLVGRLDG